VSVFAALYDIANLPTHHGIEMLDPFIFYHQIFILPPILLLTLSAGFLQAWKTHSLPDTEALSPKGLALKAAVFAAVGVSWMFRFGYPWDSNRISWVHFLGWIAILNLTFSFMELGLLDMVARRARERSRIAELNVPQEDETSPLLQS